MIKRARGRGGAPRGAGSGVGLVVSASPPKPAVVRTNSQGKVFRYASSAPPLPTSASSPSSSSAHDLNNSGEDLVTPSGAPVEAFADESRNADVGVISRQKPSPLQDVRGPDVFDSSSAAQQRRASQAETLRALIAERQRRQNDSPSPKTEHKSSKLVMKPTKRRILDISDEDVRHPKEQDEEDGDWTVQKEDMMAEVRALPDYPTKPSKGVGATTTSPKTKTKHSSSAGVLSTSAQPVTGGQHRNSALALLAAFAPPAPPQPSTHSVAKKPAIGVKPSAPGSKEPPVMFKVNKATGVIAHPSVSPVPIPIDPPSPTKSSPATSPVKPTTTTQDARVASKATTTKPFVPSKKVNPTDASSAGQQQEQPIKISKGGSSSMLPKGTEQQQQQQPRSHARPSGQIQQNQDSGAKRTVQTGVAKKRSNSGPPSRVQHPSDDVVDDSPEKNLAHYQPYTVEDFRRINQPVKMGALGYVDTEEKKQGRNARAKMKVYSQAVRDVNVVTSVVPQDDLKPIVQPPDPAKELAKEKRLKALEFAARVPKPKVKPSASEQPIVFRGAGTTNAQDEIALREQQHLLDCEYVQQLKRELRM